MTSFRILLVVCVVPCLGAALGCDLIDPSTLTGGTGGGGSGGAGGGGGGDLWFCHPQSTWAGTGGDVNIPECPLPYSAAFKGTIDGQPYDERLFNCNLAGGELPGVGDTPPFSMTMACNPPIQLQTSWDTPGRIFGDFVPVTEGFFRLPGEWPKRALLPGSFVRMHCGYDNKVQYILVLEGGELTGCLRADNK